MTTKDLFNTKPKLNRLPEKPESGPGRFPKWLHRKMPKGRAIFETQEIVKKAALHTVCAEAKCPNLLECFSQKTATFLLLGKSCTRACSFCDIDHNPTPGFLDPKEPELIAKSVSTLGLKHVVLTMVARDDLPDGGAMQIKHVVDACRKVNPESTIELLTSDFQENTDSLNTILSIEPEIFNHNVETVKRLSARVRHKATYERSLRLLSYMKEQNPSLTTKSGIMVGLGEERDEVFETISDLKDAGCSIITIGQYLQASQKKTAVKAFITPETFAEYEAYGKKIGVEHMYVGPFVRSSYNAGLFINNKKIEST